MIFVTKITRYESWQMQLRSETPDLVIWSGNQEAVMYFMDIKTQQVTILLKASIKPPQIISSDYLNII